MKALKEVRRFSCDYRIVNPDGEIRWMRTVSSPLLAADGTPTSYVGVCEDITERKWAEDALRESEERFRTLSASAPVGIFLMDEGGQIVFTNERDREIAGVLLQCRFQRRALSVRPHR